MPSTDTLKTVGNAAKNAVTQTAVQYKDIYTTINDMVQAFWQRVPYLIIAVLIFIIFWLLSKVFKIVVRKTLGQHAHKKQNLVLVLNRIGSTFIVFLGLMIALVIAIPGFTPGQLVSALGIGSVAIGFAFKDVFQNLLSGILILLSEPFRMGDQIVSGGFEGTVENIQIRATYIRTYDGRRIVIPNAQLFTSVVTVNTAYTRRRISIDLKLSYSDDIDHAKSIIAETLSTMPSVSKEPAPPTVVVKELLETAVVINLRWWIDASTQVNVTSSTDDVLSAVKNALKREGILWPIPTPPTGLLPSAAPAPRMDVPLAIPTNRDLGETSTPERD
jgi:small conductance mechanosensitive channel